MKRLGRRKAVVTPSESDERIHKSLNGNGEGTCFRGNGLGTRREEGADPGWSVTDEQRRRRAVSPKTLRATVLLDGGRRWLGPHSPLWGCSGLAAWATTRIPRRRSPPRFRSGSKPSSTTNGEARSQCRTKLRQSDWPRSANCLIAIQLACVHRVAIRQTLAHLPRPCDLLPVASSDSSLLGTPGIASYRIRRDGDVLGMPRTRVAFFSPRDLALASWSLCLLLYALFCGVPDDKGIIGPTAMDPVVCRWPVFCSLTPS